jgi:hypothetical protein
MMGVTQTTQLLAVRTHELLTAVSFGDNAHPRMPYQSLDRAADFVAIHGDALGMPAEEMAIAQWAMLSVERFMSFARHVAPPRSAV